MAAYRWVDDLRADCLLHRDTGISSGKEYGEPF